MIANNLLQDLNNCYQGEFMSRHVGKEFVCPVCGWTKKAPYTEAEITAHMKTHDTGKTPRARITKSDLLKLQ